MAGVSTKEIKNRIRSMESTKQITKAMEMVASSKLRRAQNQVLACRPYFETLKSAIHQIVDSTGELDSPYLEDRPVKHSVYVVIAGDRGLAGGYNSNILKLCYGQMAEEEISSVVPMGKKAVEFFMARGASLRSEAYSDAEDISVSDCFTLAKALCRAYKAGEIDRIVVGYTNFVSVLSQIPTTLQLLPLPRNEVGKESAASEVVYEPGCEEVLDAIIPEYLGGVLYGALCESRAAEQAARRTAMDSATSNAQEMIADLSLKYNRARQAAITQEITEIVAGG